MSWRPLLAGTSHEAEVRRVVATIVEQLTELPVVGGGLVDGGAGIALFMGRLARAIPEYRHLDETAGAWVEAGADWLVDRAPDAGLFHGFAGLGWTADHLHRLIGDVDLELHRELDDAILAQPPAHFDLVTGLVGVGVYALERIACDSGRAVLAVVLDGLEDHAARGLYTPVTQLGRELREAFPSGYYDLGLAHGTPGVIAMLVRAAEIEPRAGELVATLVPWLLAKRSDAQATQFPGRLAPDRPPQAARSAWCYGDAGIALTLVRAARVGDPAWRDAGIAIARRAVVRAPDETGNLDGTWCHGAGGYAHLLARLYAATGDELVRDAALDWYARTLAHGLVAATEVGPEPAGPHLLHGLTGIGLVLTSAISAIDPDWDRAFLLS